MRIVGSVFSLIFTIFCSNCSEQIFSNFPASKVIQSESKFVGEMPQNIKITENKIDLPTEEILTEIFSFDEKDFGFIGNKFDDKKERRRTFFKTTDGGKSWRNYEVKIPEGAGISQSFFINQNVGWLLLFNNGMGWDESKRAWLMKTTDGGKTWNMTKTANKTTFEEIFFTDEKSGWMIENEYSLEPTAVVKPLVYKTSDGGENWTDVSSGLRSLIEINSGNAQIGNLLVENSESIKVTNKYDIFETTDGGKSWHNYGIDFSFLRDQNAIGNLGNIGQTKRIKAAQGGMTTEGRYVYLATEEKNGKWTNREIKEPINLSNVFFPTENDAFMFGIIQEGFTKEDWESKKGVIYYSANGGETFSKIYQSENSGPFGKINKLSDNKFFVISASGLIISIEF